MITTNPNKITQVKEKNYLTYLILIIFFAIQAFKGLSRSTQQRCFIKKVFLEISLNDSRRLLLTKVASPSQFSC